MVDSIRRYGMAFVAAAVLLPPQLVAMGVLACAIVYMWMRYIWKPATAKR